MGKTTVDLLVANNHDIALMLRGALPPDQVRSARIQGTVDSAASHLVLPEKVVNQLGLPKEEDRPVTYADRRTVVRTIVEEARVELLGRHGVYKAIVEPDRTTALVGAIILEDLDFLLDCRAQRLVPRDPSGAIYEVE